MPRLRCRNHRNKIEGVHRCKIFDIGLGRNATRSICKAVEQFGLEVMHGFGRCKGCEKNDIEKYLRHECDFSIYKTCDYSSNVASIHWRQLIDTYPEAKFILPLRPIDAWLHKYQNNPRVTEAFLERFMKGQIGWAPIYCMYHFGVITYDRKMWKDGYERHTKDILNTIDPGRLLVLNVFEMSDEELWSKLAIFLGCEVPNPIEPFPKYQGIILHKE